MTPEHPGRDTGRIPPADDSSGCRDHDHTAEEAVITAFADPPPENQHATKHGCDLASQLAAEHHPLGTCRNR